MLTVMITFKCVDTDSDQWEANFMEGLAQDVGSDAHCTVEQNNSDSDDLDIPPPPPRIKKQCKH